MAWSIRPGELIRPVRGQHEQKPRILVMSEPATV
jgi:hypothetical protein